MIKITANPNRTINVELSDLPVEKFEVILSVLEQASKATEPPDATPGQVWDHKVKVCQATDLYYDLRNQFSLVEEFLLTPCAVGAKVIQEERLAAKKK